MSSLIGNTPLKQLHDLGKINVFAKLEFYNHSGSIKDRAAYRIIHDGIISGAITSETTIVESSSGNLALALSMICRELQLKFIPVIDPNINILYERYLNILNPEVIKVTDKDPTGGYLLTRIKRVKDLIAERSKVFWTNQYENPSNYLAYFTSMGDEIEKKFDHLEFLFVAVSSGGTITGLSRRLKERFNMLKIIAVDAEGSLIFSSTPAPRYIPGIGASMKPGIIKNALIDEVVHVSQHEIINGTHTLLQEQNIFCGGSSGACYHAIKKFASSGYFKENDNILFICPDKGDSYINSIYSPQWIATLDERTMLTNPKIAPETGLL